jgi:hypothetical protein
VPMSGTNWFRAISKTTSFWLTSSTFNPAAIPGLDMHLKLPIKIVKLIHMHQHTCQLQSQLYVCAAANTTSQCTNKWSPAVTLPWS